MMGKLPSFPASAARLMLFPPPLEQLDFLIDGAHVSGYEHRWSKDRAGRLWVRKREQDVGVEVIAAEIIGWRLAQCLSVPVPAAALYRNDRELGSMSWLSQAVRPASHWDGDRANYINNLEMLGNTLVLDVLILNSDRHAGNLLLEPRPDELNLHLWAIDTGNALVSYPSDFLGSIERVPEPACAPGIPWDHLRACAMEISDMATKIIPSYVSMAVAEAYELTNISEREAVTDALLGRCKRAPELVSRYLSKVPARALPKVLS